jgi:hypothetical protein
MKLTRGAAATIVAWTVSLAAPIAEAGEPSPTLVDSMDAVPREVSVDAPRLVIGLRLRPGVTLSRSVKIVSVTRDGEIYGSDSGRFVASLEGDAVRIELEIDAGPPLPAQYEVAVRLTGSLDGGGAEQDVLVRLRLPNARLRPLGTLVLERDLGLLGRDNWKGPHDIELRETGERTALTNLTIDQPDRATADRELVTPRLEAPDASATVPRGAGVRFDLEPSSSAPFPPGVSRAKLEVRGDQLREPFAVDVEVRAKYSGGWFFAAFLIGATLGWVMRSLLKQRSETHQLKLRAEDVKERLQAEIARLPQGALFALLERADEKRAGDAPDAMRKRLVDAVGAIDEAGGGWLRPENLGKAVAEAEAGLGSVGPWRAQLGVDSLNFVRREISTLAAHWTLPAAVNGLDAVCQAWVDLRKPLEVDDIAKADVAVATARLRAQDVEASAIAWARDVTEALEKAASAPLPASARATLAASAGGVSSVLPAQNANPFLTSLAPILRSLHDAETKLVLLADRLRRELGATAEGVAAELGPPGDSSIVEAAKIVDAVDGLVRLDHVVRAGLRMKESVVNALKAVDPNLSDAVRTALESGNYLDGVRAHMEGRSHVVRKPEGTDAVASVATEIGPAADAAPTATRPPFPTLEGSSITLAQLLVGRGASPLSAALARSLGDVIFDRALGAGLAVILVSITSWALYKDAWTGSLRDFLGVFAAAFLTDFSVDAVSDTFAKLRK